MADQEEKAYLGDGVYAQWEEPTLSVVLTTEDGITQTNRIVLEPEVLDALKQWLWRKLEARHKVPHD